MAIKTILFLSGFAAAAAVTLFVPVVGVLAYVAHYSLGVERWWFVYSTRPWGIRYSFTLAALTAVSMLCHFHKLRYGSKLLLTQERLLLLFLGIVWLSLAISGGPLGSEEGYDHPVAKLTKVVAFTLMLTHVVTSMRKLDAVLWLLVLSGLSLGIQAYTVPATAFGKGRLELVGGPDFKEANFLAAYLASILPLIGVQFLRSKWPGKLLCLGSGAFAVNAIILTRSRGAVVGITAGAAAAALLAPRKFRLKILAGLMVAAIGGLCLVDAGFLARARTIGPGQGEGDGAIESRVAIWAASRQLLRENPLGVGAGNFKYVIGRYAPEHVGRDAHSTFVRCYGELGVHGMATFLILVGSAMWMLRRAVKRARTLPAEPREHVTYVGYAIALGLITFLACGFTMSLLYLEAFWWLLLLPVCLVRADGNVRAAVATASAAGGKVGRGRARRKRRGTAPLRQPGWTR